MVGLVQLKDNKFICYGKPEGTYSNYGSTICEDFSGNIYGGYRETGLFILTIDKTLKFSYNPGLPSNEILSVLPARNGGLWLSYARLGLIRYFENGIISGIELLNYFETHYDIPSLFENNNAHLWIGGRATVAKLENNN